MLYKGNSLHITRIYCILRWWKHEYNQLVMLLIFARLTFSVKVLQVKGAAVHVARTRTEDRRWMKPDQSSLKPMITLTYSEASRTANDTQTRLTRTRWGWLLASSRRNSQWRDKTTQKYHVTRKTQLLPLSVTWLPRLVQTNTEKTVVQRVNGLITGGSLG